MSHIMNIKIAAPLALFFLRFSSAQEPHFDPAERGPHHTMWRNIVQVDDPERPGTITNSFVQLEDGLNVFSATENTWIPASDEIELINGFGVARKAQHKVVFAPALTDPNGVVDLTMPDGKRVRIRPIGLAFTDQSTG